MEEQVYIVTLYKKEDLEQFYNEMEDKNISLVDKRPISRNTLYRMTESQAEELRSDPRVWDVVDKDKIIITDDASYSYNSYNRNGQTFRRDVSSLNQFNSTDTQWGLYHSNVSAHDGNLGRKLPTASERDKGSNWGAKVPAQINYYGDGADVDIVICDSSIAKDSSEWSDGNNGTRFVEYNWLQHTDNPNNLSIVYDTVANATNYHGTAVAGVAAGRHYGWARAANIYNIAVTNSFTLSDGSSLSIGNPLDFVKVFHNTKILNNITRPTIANCSFAFQFGLRLQRVTALSFSGNPYNDMINTINNYSFQNGDRVPVGVQYRGTEYLFENNQSRDYGYFYVQFGIDLVNSVSLIDPTLIYLGLNSAASAAEEEDAIDAGVIVVASAGNDNAYVSREGDRDWENALLYRTYQNGSLSNTIEKHYYHRGGSPGGPTVKSLDVGAISASNDFRKATFSNYGPSVDTFAPGHNILAPVVASKSSKIEDTKTGYSSTNPAYPNAAATQYWYPTSGTSFAAPQVTGILACTATGYVNGTGTVGRFTQDEVLTYINQFAFRDQMTGDLNPNSAWGDDTHLYRTENKDIAFIDPINNTSERFYVYNTSGLVDDGLDYFCEDVLKARLMVSQTDTTSTSNVVLELNPEEVLEIKNLFDSQTAAGGKVYAHAYPSILYEVATVNADPVITEFRSKVIVQSVDVTANANSNYEVTLQVDSGVTDPVLSAALVVTPGKIKNIVFTTSNVNKEVCFRPTDTSPPFSASASGLNSGTRDVSLVKEFSSVGGANAGVLNQTATTTYSALEIKDGSSHTLNVSTANINDVVDRNLKITDGSGTEFDILLGS